MEDKNRKNIYTKRELKLIKNPIKALALAVIEQWKADGKPVGDAGAIEVWKKIYCSEEVKYSD